MADFHIYTLSNGIRVVHLPLRGKIAHLGLMIEAGTRDELPEQNGLAHFIEHALFKGTEKRKTYHILSRLDRVGGELNAYTGKEDTTIHASFLKQYLDRAAEIISDIVFHSTFPEHEITKEKEVILDEIMSYRDTPSELIFDEFDEMAFGNHPLAMPVLGTAESVGQLNRDHIRAFIDEHYTTERMVLCVAGEVTKKKLLHILEQRFGQVPANSGNTRKRTEIAYTPFHKTIDRDTHQLHLLMGNMAYDLHHPNKTACNLVNNLLGGPGLNSILNLEVREKYGIAYNIESNYQPYSDAGILTIYLGTDPEQLAKSKRLIAGILKRLRTRKLGVLQLHLAKKQLIGHIALAQENNINHMLSLGKSLLVYDKIDSDEEVERRIQQVTAEEVLEVSETLFGEDLSELVYR